MQTKYIFFTILMLAKTTLFAQDVPAITSFSPTSGPVGTTVTITGINFDATPANNTVFFGATQADVSAATTTTLTVTVPLGASYQPVSVLAGGLLAYSSAPFVVTFSGPDRIDAGSFAQKANFRTGMEPQSVAIGDLDGDGRADLVVANEDSHTVSVFRNTSTGAGVTSYAAREDFDTGFRPNSVAIGDLDGDGRADLAVTNQSSHTVSVFRNTSTPGDISYAARKNFDAESESLPTSVAIGDLDGDGRADLAVVNLLGHTVSVFRNTSTGAGVIRYAARADFATGSGSTRPASVAIGDLDGDGRADLVVANENSHTVSVFRNTSTVGAISYAPKADFSTGSRPISVAIGDLDGDGQADLAVANSSVANSSTDFTVSVFRNTSTGAGVISYATRADFATGISPISVAIGDLDGDGRADLAVANETSHTVSVFRNISTPGAISYAPKADFSTGSGPVSVAIGDLDGDGQADLAVANLSSNSVSVFRNTRSETAMTTFALAEQRSSATIDPASQTVDIEVVYGTDVSALVAEFTLSAGATATIGAASQQSGATANDFSSAVIYTVTAEDGTTQDWTVNVTRAPASTRTAITAFSFAAQTGSATLDSASQTVDIEVAYGTDVSALVADFTLPAGATARVGTVLQQSRVTANDFSSAVIYTVTGGDGTSTQDWTVNVEIPLFSANIPTITSFTPTSGPVGTTVTITGTNFGATLSENIVFFGATEARVSTATATTLTVTVPPGASYQPVTVLTGGLLAWSSAPFLVTFSGSDGIDDRLFAPGEDFSTGSGSGPGSVAIGDLDGDGKADLAVVNSRSVSVFRNTSTGAGVISYATKMDFPTGTGSISVAIGDLDGDGRADLVVANDVSKTFSVFRNTSTPGDISYAERKDFDTESRLREHSIAIGDLNGDGRADLAVANEFSHTVSVFRNTSTGAGVISYAREDFPTGMSPTSVAISDLDGDGKADLVVTHVGISSNDDVQNVATNTVSVFRSIGPTGMISYAAREDFTTSDGEQSFPVAVAIGDMDGDGRADLVVVNEYSNTVSVFRNTSIPGDIRYAAKVDFSRGTGLRPISVAIGDLDGDGEADLAIVNEDGYSVSVLENLSNTTSFRRFLFLLARSVFTGRDPGSVAIGDLDGDGEVDLVVTNRHTGNVSVFRNTTAKTAITAFSFAAQTGSATIDPASQTVAIEVAYGTDVSALVADFTLSTGAIARVGTVSQQSGITANDFSSAVIYTVTAEDGTTTQDWTVSVTEAPNTATAMTAFSFAAQTGSATIDPASQTVDIEVAYGTDVSAIVAEFTLSAGATARAGTVSQQSGITANDFSSAVIYTVTAEDGTTTQDWTVSVTTAAAPNTETAITAFAFAAQTGIATIDPANQTVAIEVAYGTDVSTLVAGFILSTGATARAGTVSQQSGITANDFSSAVIYTVTAEDGTTTQDWTVSVTTAAAPNTETAMTAFAFAAQTGSATIDPANQTVAIEVAHGTDVSALVADFTLSAGTTATIGAASQQSGATANDFSSAVTYTVTAEDGTTTQDWTVSVTTVPNTETVMTAFSFAAQAGSATIDPASQTVVIEVAYGTDVSALVAEFTLSAGATARVGTVSQQSGITANDFSSAVIYTVTAEDGITTQDWTVSVTTARPLSFSVTNATHTLMGSPYPNPSDGAFVLPVAIAADSDIDILIRDLSGRLVLTKAVGGLKKGSHVLAIDLRFETGEATPSGTYFIEMNITTRKGEPLVFRKRVLYTK